MKRKILTNVQLLDGVSAAPLKDAVLIIEGEQIAWVGPKHSWDGAVRPGDALLDLGGLFVLPGLWDLHVHLDFRIQNTEGQSSVADATLFAYRRALTFLNSGVTSLRVAGTANGVDFALKRGISGGEYVGPRLFTAGSGLCSTGGHGSSAGAGLDGPYEFRRAARQMLCQGADFVKLMVTGGILGEHEAFDAPQTLADEVQAAVEVAHNWGKHVSGHIASAAAAIMCAELGVDTIEHGYALDRRALEVMAKHGATYVPTLVVTDCPQYWAGIGFPKWAVEKIRKAAPSHRRSVEMALEMGVAIALGSDTPTAMVDGAIATVREMEAVQGVGAKPRDLINWATKRAAEICGVGAETGTLEAGKAADLLAVPRDPYLSVSHLKDVRLVISKGTIVRDALAGPRKPLLLAGRLEHETS